MTAAGWVFMVVSVGSVVSVMVFCFSRVLRGPKPADSGAVPPDGDAPDSRR